MLNVFTAVAYHFCLALPAAFTQPGDRLLAEPCTLIFCHTERRERNALGANVMSVLSTRWLVGMFDDGLAVRLASKYRNSIIFHISPPSNAATHHHQRTEPLFRPLLRPLEEFLSELCLLLSDRLLFSLTLGCLVKFLGSYA